MSWAPSVPLEIANLFRGLGGCIDPEWFVGSLIVSDKGLAELIRRERMAIDPAYAARRKAQMKSSRSRRKAALGIEAQRAEWRRRKQEQRDRRSGSTALMQEDKP